MNKDTIIEKKRGQIKRKQKFRRGSVKSEIQDQKQNRIR